jgi:hypothetical protein
VGYSQSEDSWHLCGIMAWITSYVIDDPHGFFTHLLSFPVGMRDVHDQSLLVSWWFKFKMRNKKKCLICLFCAMQFLLLTMRIWQHSGPVFTWILRHQIVDPVVLCQAKVVGAQVSAPTEEQQVLQSGHFQQWERM